VQHLSRNGCRRLQGGNGQHAVSQHSFRQTPVDFLSASSSRALSP
jgi:hypothetical protein